jgi:pre-mRNA-splicing factor 18
MDFLKAEIATKRKILDDDPANGNRPNKYMRRGEVEKLKEEQERKEREAKEKERQETAAKKVRMSLH